MPEPQSSLPLEMVRVDNDSNSQPAQQSDPLDTVDEEDFYQQWKDIADALDEYYKDREKVICEQLDGFLSFSGIFSAVVTLFVGQSVTWLQPDNARHTVDILRRISRQISNRTTAPAFLSAQETQSLDSEYMDYITEINDALSAFFLSSLVLSLSVSFISLWTKKCLRMYLLDLPSSPYNRALLQIYRYHVLRKWMLHDVTMPLFALLVTSIASFCCGMTNLAFKLDFDAIVYVLFGVYGVTAIGFLVSCLGPLLFPSCPFNAWTVSPKLFCLKTTFWRPPSPRSVRELFGKIHDWKPGDIFHTVKVETRKLEEMRRYQVSLELEALTFANRKFWGSKRLKAINILFTEVTDRQAALDCILGILQRRDGYSESGKPVPLPATFPRSKTDDELVINLQTIGRQIFTKLMKAERKSNDSEPSDLARIAALESRYRTFRPEAEAQQSERHDGDVHSEPSGSGWHVGPTN